MRGLIRITLVCCALVLMLHSTKALAMPYMQSSSNGIEYRSRRAAQGPSQGGGQGGGSGSMGGGAGMGFSVGANIGGQAGGQPGGQGGQ
ncbi:uncharacterized protein LOC129243043 [Anastrepha obliqua]|uniref:uncharacterized protein LOC129243043 n=1 Tax=Anastrepha obliqua TaxID=95512 RepID=UPI00240971BE|nr:uncharacterized protein LOC129243043 [Anastrepha obliqua]